MQPEQPEALKDCQGPCCDLDKRACKGKGAHAKAFRKIEGTSSKRMCKFVKDPTLQITADNMKSRKRPVYGMSFSSLPLSLSRSPSSLSTPASRRSLSFSLSLSLSPSHSFFLRSSRLSILFILTTCCCSLERLVHVGMCVPRA